MSGMDPFIMSPPEPDIRFSPDFYAELNAMSAENAVTTCQTYLDRTVAYRDHYEQKMLASPYGSEAFKGFQHAYWIENNNILRFHKLITEIKEEL